MIHEKQINSGVLVAVKNAYFGAMINTGLWQFLDIKKRSSWNICQPVVKRSYFFLLPGVHYVDLNCFCRPPHWHKLYREWSCFIFAVQVHTLWNYLAHSIEKNHTLQYNTGYTSLFFKHPLSSLQRWSPDYRQLVIFLSKNSLI